jgi:hypothetical protein
VIPPYDAVVLASARIARDAPDVLAALRRLEGEIDAESMRGMNRRWTGRPHPPRWRGVPGGLAGGSERGTRTPRPWSAEGRRASSARRPRVSPLRGRSDYGAWYNIDQLTVSFGLFASV